MYSIVNGRFYPFEAVVSSKSDFDMDELAKALELSSLQKQLLWEFLCRMEIQIWFVDDENEPKNPRFELLVFWEPCDMGVVAEIDLDRLLETTFERCNQIGDENEIAALENLRRKIDEAIELRKN
jgi:hypothetical protein